MSRRAINNLNSQYPDVTAEQLRAYSDTICIICREEMSSPAGVNDNAANQQQIKRLPCDHIFHKSCLRSWFQRQQTCPTCRTSILRITPLQAAANQAAAAAAAAAAQPAPGAAPQQAAGANNANQPQPGVAIVNDLNNLLNNAQPLNQNPFFNNLFANLQQPQQQQQQQPFQRPPTSTTSITIGQTQYPSFPFPPHMLGMPQHFPLPPFGKFLH
jgi:E3 ubiquitin-protein ligase synoviolin